MDDHSDKFAPLTDAEISAGTNECPQAQRAREARTMCPPDDAEHGRVCLTNNAAERALRGFALGRKAWLFAGSDRGADRAAFMATLITTAKLNDVDPQAWLADVLARIADTPTTRLTELLPWNWTAAQPAMALAS